MKPFSTSSFFRSLLKRRAFANLLMAAFLAGGLTSASTIRQELLPDREARLVRVEVELRGASPEDIDNSILAAVENAVRGLDGIKRIDGQAREGLGIVDITLLKSAVPQLMLADIKTAVNRIATFPEDAEEPVVILPVETEKALSIVVYGDQPLLWLRRTAEAVRDDLRTLSGLKKVQLAFPREQEISVEISEKTLRQYGWSIEDVAEKIRESSLDLPGGTLFSPRADIALRTAERRLWAEEFSDVIVSRTQEGVPLRLSDIAALENGFGESPIEAWFNGKPAIQLDVFCVGDETPTSVEASVRDYLETIARNKYQGVEIVVFENEAAAYRSRMGLLIDNALLGLALVLIALGLFLSPEVAFWVMAGIPTSLVGGLLLLPLFGGSINMLSLFAFIVSIGVVVDDAIMVGEAIHACRSRGLDRLSAAVQGLKEMGGPVFLATSTTVLAFTPMFFVPGDMGTLFRQIPSVVVAVLAVSLVESLFILVAHLAKPSGKRPWPTRIALPHRAVNAALDRFVRGAYRNFMKRALDRPGAMFMSAISLLVVTSGAIFGDLLEFSFTPVIESDTVIAQATLPYGSPKRHSVAVQQALVSSAEKVLNENRMTSPGIFSLVGTRLEEGEVEMETLAGSHYISALVALPPEKDRSLSGRQFAQVWQSAFETPGELEALHFTGETKVTGGEPVRLEVFHPDPSAARAAALSLGERLRGVPGLSSIDDGIRAGKPELTVALKENSLHMGLSAQDVAKQVRHRYHGAEALRFARGSGEVKVMVRLCKEERTRPEALREALLKRPSGELVPLTEIADISRNRSFTTLARRDGKRIYPVTADIGIGIGDDMVEDILEDHIIPEIVSEHPGVAIAFGGEEEEIDESLASLGNGFLIVLGVIFMLFAFYFNSCAQPLLVLSVVPFSLVGAVWGHILLAADLSIVSVVGIVAMAGVVVNDSMVLVAAYNRFRIDGAAHPQAVLDAACHRFRPILLTSLTTFFGLTPLLLETSEQAQFLIPAAISIAFGLAFGTVVTLVLLPCFLNAFAGRKQCQ